MELLISVVVYKEITHTINFINSNLKFLDGIEYKIVFLDNYEKYTIDEKKEIENNITTTINNIAVCDLNSEMDLSNIITYIFGNKNIGYAKGNNLVFSLFSESNDFSQFLVSNNDIIFNSDTIINTLQQNIKEEVGMVFPKVIGVNGVDQNPFRYMSIFKKYVLLMFSPIIGLINPYIFADRIIDNDYSKVYRANGCFMMFSKQAYYQMGLMDENTFLYAEELIISERLKKENFTIKYIDDVFITHYHNVSIGKYYSIRKKNKMMFESNMYYYKNYIKVNIIMRLMARISFFIYNNFFSYFVEKFVKKNK